MKTTAASKISFCESRFSKGIEISFLQKNPRGVPLSLWAFAKIIDLVFQRNFIGAKMAGIPTWNADL